MKDGKYRMVLDDEALRCICIALRSLSKSGHQSEYRKALCNHLVLRLEERGMGNPYLVHYGRKKAQNG